MYIPKTKYFTTCIKVDYYAENSLKLNDIKKFVFQNLKKVEIKSLYKSTTF